MTANPFAACTGSLKRVELEGNGHTALAVAGNDEVVVDDIGVDVELVDVEEVVVTWDVLVELVVDELLPHPTATTEPDSTAMANVTRNLML